MRKSKNARRKSNRRKFIFKRDKGLCQYCYRPGDTLDHLMPQVRGGTSIRANLVVACKRCNSAKGNLTPLEYFFEVDRSAVGRLRCLLAV